MKLKNFITSFQRFLNGLKRPSKKTNLKKLVGRGESFDSFTFKDATKEDVPELGKLHAITWAETYSGAANIQLRQYQWQKTFAEENDGSWFCILAVDKNKKLVGFAKGKTYKHSDLPGFSGELNKIYLLKEYQRIGLGRRLMSHVAHRFLDMNINNMVLFGIPQNPSCTFHEAMGGERLYAKNGEFHGGYCWKDLKKLANELV
jgi:GNAT superfamily N-acetyltransferase